MKATAMLEALETAATGLEVRVSYESLSSFLGHGGLCRVRGEYRVIIDKRATTEERVATLAQSLGKVDTGGRSLPAKVKELVDFYSDRRSARAPARGATRAASARAPGVRTDRSRESVRRAAS